MSATEKVSLLLFLLIVAAVYTAEFILVILALYDKFSSGRNPTFFFSKPVVVLHFSKPVVVLHVIALAGIGCMLYGRFVEPRWVEVNHITLRSDKLKSTSIRIAHISDLHCESRPLNEEKAVRIINSAEPDIVVFTGDALNCEQGLDNFRSTLSQLKAAVGKFAITGNIDARYFSNLDLFKDTGFRCLDANSIALHKDGETFHVTGVKWPHGRRCKRLLGRIPQNQFSILLYHTPDVVEDLADCNVDLYLAGHTHGGQVALPFYGPLLTLSKHGKKYEAGLYHVGDTTVYVNRGLGLEGGRAPRVRFLARPEITIIDIVPKNNLP